jgi:hypothetical protein
MGTAAPLGVLLRGKESPECESSPQIVLLPDLGPRLRRIQILSPQCATPSPSWRLRKCFFINEERVREPGESFPAAEGRYKRNHCGWLRRDLWPGTHL